MLYAQVGTHAVSYFPRDVVNHSSIDVYRIGCVFEQLNSPRSNISIVIVNSGLLNCVFTFYIYIYICASHIILKVH